MGDVINLQGMTPQERLDNNIKELEESLKNAKEINAEWVIDDCIDSIYSSLYKITDPKDSDKDFKLVSLIMESIRAFIYNTYGIDHPLQDISDNIFDIETDEDGFKTAKLNKDKIRKVING